MSRTASATATLAVAVGALGWAGSGPVTAATAPPAPAKPAVTAAHSPASHPTATAARSCRLVITADGVRFRDSAGGGHILGLLYRGETLTPTQFPAADWYQAYSSKIHRTGWVSQQYATLVGC